MRKSGPCSTTGSRISWVSLKEAMSRRGADWLSRARVAVDGQRQALRHRQPLATDLATLRMRAEFPDRRRSTVRCVTGNVRAMHADPELERALFQVASQFNLLEMTGP